MRRSAMTGLTFLACSIALGVAVVRHDASRRANRRGERQQVQDWENEGGALSTASQVPGAADTAPAPS
jgi:hypothetical protein